MTGAQLSPFPPISLLLLYQGSYGVVKLAYNEDDNTYYVSSVHKH